MRADNYPAGAYADVNAPYNQVDTPEIPVTCYVSVTLTNKVRVWTDNYDVEIDEEDGSQSTNLLDSYSDLAYKYSKQCMSIPDMLEELVKYIDLELQGEVSWQRKHELKEMREAAKGWSVEDTDVEDYNIE